jgi:hypothetical protein
MNCQSIRNLIALAAPYNMYLGQDQQGDEIMKITPEKMWHNLTRHYHSVRI